MKRATAIAVVAVVSYAILWLAYAQHWHWLSAFDHAVLRWFYDYGVKHPLWLRIWDEFCTAFGPEGFRLVGIAVIVVAAVRRNLPVVLFIFATIEASGVITLGAKQLADRPRPSTALATAASTSFPSGHALAVMAAVLALLTISSGMAARRARMFWIALGAVIVIAVGMGRVVLNVHYPSDVLAGWALGYLWYLCCLLVIRPLPLTAERRLRSDQVTSAPGGTPRARGTAR